eukprot:GFUD01002685.1.p1 GENE.GFUD01002685.1~~GFUD01002685.1.p1  ORF type:complete len:189 (+),score=53.02 GFUD01002685.1:67-633(+)
MIKNSSRPPFVPKKRAPEVSIEWVDVTIDIKVCGMDILPEERRFVRLFPDMDPKLISSDVLDSRKAETKEKKKPKYKDYEYVPKKDTGRPPPKVLPKLTCNHCGKLFSRKSTLEQHLVTHSATSHDESWEEVQDAAVKDLEQAISPSSLPGEVSIVQNLLASHLNISSQQKEKKRDKLEAGDKLKEQE